MLTIHSEPALRDPVLLCAFSGWADAASAASGALRYLLLKRSSRRIAEFDPDSLYAYTATRPVSILESPGRRRLEWPDLAFHAVEVPEEPHDLLILVGPEPDLRWRECVRTVGSFAATLGVSRVLAFGGFLAQVHYAGPAAMMGVSFDPQMRARMRRMGLAESNYQGSTSILTAILQETSARGIPAGSLWVAAPSYLASTTNPKLAAALLRSAEELLGQSLWLDELETAGRDMERRIEEALSERPDLVTFLQRLSSESSPPPATPPPAEEPEPELPSAEDVLKDLEDHLRRLQHDSGREGEE